MSCENMPLRKHTNGKRSTQKTAGGMHVVAYNIIVVAAKQINNADINA